MVGLSKLIILLLKFIMKKTLLFSGLLAIVLLSCHKQDIIPADEKTLRPPSGFSWEMSSNISINIGINDSRFAGALHSISIYDAPPQSRGRLITMGSATNDLPFITTIYLANALQTLARCSSRLYGQALYKKPCLHQIHDTRQ